MNGLFQLDATGIAANMGNIDDVHALVDDTVATYGGLDIIINLIKAMAQDWGIDNIRVNVICPGLIKTKFSEALWKDESTCERFIKHIPLGRIGEPDDIKGLAVYLASPASAYCTGGIYMVDGGYAAN